MKHLINISAVFLLAVLLSACLSNESNVYTGPPPRDIDLDSIDDETTGEYYNRPPDHLTVGFLVPEPDTCRVIINLHLNKEKVIRHILDDTYPPGSHEYTWNTLDSHLNRLPQMVYYYDINICGQRSVKSLKYRTGDFGTRSR